MVSAVNEADTVNAVKWVIPVADVISGRTTNCYQLLIYRALGVTEVSCYQYFLNVPQTNVMFV